MNLFRFPSSCILLCALFSLFGASAQEAPSKELIILELFARDRTVPRAYAEALRQQVGAALEQRGRFRIADAEANPDVLNAGDLIDPATAPDALMGYLVSRTSDMLQTGARYAINGAVTEYKFEHVMLPRGGENPPLPGFRTTFVVLLSSFDYRLAKPVGMETFTLTATAPIAEDADRAAIALLAGKLTFYIDRNFQFETTILDLCPPEGRKQVIKELYIHSGVEMGVTGGDTFNVYEELLIGGVSTRELVGRVRVNNVHDTGIAHCKITKGSDEIIRAFRQGTPLICVSDIKALFY